MKIEHVAIWTKDLEKMRSFYRTFFNVHSNQLYFNPKKEFSSYFLSFESGARIELMYNPDVSKLLGTDHPRSGLAHIAISVGSREKVDLLTEEIRNVGHKILGEPRITGDGYYESVVSDPEGNLIEVTE